MTIDYSFNRSCKSIQLVMRQQGKGYLYLLAVLFQVGLLKEAGHNSWCSQVLSVPFSRVKNSPQPLNKPVPYDELFKAFMAQLPSNCQYKTSSKLRRYKWVLDFHVGHKDRKGGLSLWRHWQVACTAPIQGFQPLHRPFGP